MRWKRSYSSMPNISPMSKYYGYNTTERRVVWIFLETLGGSYDSAKVRGDLVDACEMGSFKTYALIPC
jgi:hypothetical protein